MQTPGKQNSEQRDIEPALIDDTTNGAIFKVKFAVRAAAFCASVMTLSWFFEGWRKIHESVGVYSVSILAAGILCTLALITLQAYWIYVEEKQKGALLRRVRLFEKFYEKQLQRKAAGLGHNAKRGDKAKHA